MLDAFWPAVCAGCGCLGEEVLCGRCRPRHVHRVSVAVSSLSGAWTLAGYDSSMGHALRTAKVEGNRGLVSKLGTLLGRRLLPAVRGAAFTAVVPAPSNLWSRWQRGFSAASVLAHRVGHELSTPTVEALSRRGWGRQSALSAAERRRNLRGRVQPRRAVSGRILLIDDVVTTGSTAAVCVEELMRAGASEIWLAALCVARRESGC